MFQFSLLKSCAKDYMPFVPHHHSLSIAKEGKGRTHHNCRAAAGERVKNSDSLQVTASQNSPKVL